MHEFSYKQPRNATRTRPKAGALDVEVGDVNRDGKLDVVTAKKTILVIRSVYCLAMAMAHFNRR